MCPCPSPNRYRSPLRALPAPGAWTTTIARRLVAAILNGRGVVDLAATPRTVTTAVTVLTARGDVSPDEVRTRLHEARLELDRLEHELRCYGTHPFVPHPREQPPPLARSGDTQESYMLRWMRALAAADLRITRAGDTPIVWVNGSYYVVTKEAAP